MSNLQPAERRYDGPEQASTGPMRGQVGMVSPGMAPPGYEQYGAPPLSAPVTTNSMAILSVVFSALGFFTLITSIPGVILGHLALAQLKKNPHQDGRSLAITGLILGYIIIGLAVAAIVLFLVVILGVAAVITQG